MSDDQQGASLNHQDQPAGSPGLDAARQRYTAATQLWQEQFRRQAWSPSAGLEAVRQRSDAVDHLVRSIWMAVEPPASGVALVAVGGYGRQELFPFSDVDLMYLLDAKAAEGPAREAIRRSSQMLWDCGLRVAGLTRTLAECERFDSENVEFTLSILDARFLTGESAPAARLEERVLPRLIGRDHKKITARLLNVTHARHAKYGNTLFHLEPNVKECPGGLRDAHVCAWLARLQPGDSAPSAEFEQARHFMMQTRVFLHLLHGRDNNVLDWEAQDEAASVGLASDHAGPDNADASYWMRRYFRHARVLARTTVLAQGNAASDVAAKAGAGTRISRSLWKLHFGREQRLDETTGFALRNGWIVLEEAAAGGDDPAANPLIMLDLFAAIAATGARLSSATEHRLERALPLLSAELEDGPMVWRRLEQILSGAFAGDALRSMHALGLLDLLLPEFHGIDALVIRDAYHRYTVDEHTFVVLDTLHGLPLASGSASGSTSGPTSGLRQNDPAREGIALKFGALLHDLPHRSLLYLAALLHDVGKGRAGADHARESARMAVSVLTRLELDSYESSLVLQLIANHLEMSATLRRDVFDAETIRTFAGRVSNPELLRMLTLFTYADISAVHPDALTPWKAENLWRLYIATANYLDRSVDEERVDTASDPLLLDLVARVQATLPGQAASAAAFLNGFPRRYLQTRTSEQIRQHLLLAEKLKQPNASGSSVQLQFTYAPAASQLTLVTQDRPMLFSLMTGVLASWGMNILTADAFSNAQGIIVDSFSFTDTFKTLEMNESERERFLRNVEDVISGRAALEAMLKGRRRGRRAPPRVSVATRIDFDDSASQHSTLLQVVAQDVAGLLRVIALTLAERGCNIEVALIDTEGERAIDVFYLTQGRAMLSASEQAALRQGLSHAIDALLAERYN